VRALPVFAALAAVLWLGAARSVGAQGTSAVPVWDTRPDTWTGVDALGRVLPLAGEVPAPRRDRFVGMFYFLWHGEHGTDGPFDVTKILARERQNATERVHAGPGVGPRVPDGRGGRPLRLRRASHTEPEEEGGERGKDEERPHRAASAASS